MSKRTRSIIVAPITPDMLTPSTACLLQGKLAAYNAAVSDISAGYGIICGLVTVENFLLNTNYRCALVVGAQTLSKVNDWTDRNTCVIFADGVGAVFLGKGSGDNGIPPEKVTDMIMFVRKLFSVL